MFYICIVFANLLSSDITTITAYKVVAFDHQMKIKNGPKNPLLMTAYDFLSFNEKRLALDTFSWYCPETLQNDKMMKMSL